VRPDNRLQIKMVFQGLAQDEARAAWMPLIDFANANSADYQGQNTLSVHALPARYFWNAGFFRRYAPSAVVFDSQPGAAPTISGGAATVARSVPFGMPIPRLGCRLRCSSRKTRRSSWMLGLPPAAIGVSRSTSNKGLAGAPAAAIEAARDTAMNPDVLDAFALAITGSYGPAAFPGFPAPNLVRGAAIRSRVQSAMAALRVAAPEAGAYVNECDYFQTDWQKAFWGPNYPRLAGIKRRYDPDGVFVVHHGVGSEV
jgi:Berberine and berberine like